MWYIYGVRWKETQGGKIERVYKISYATSHDLINWSPVFEPIIEDLIGPDECQALPSVIYHKGAYYMFFCYRSFEDFRGENNRNGYKIAYATSTDLRSWQRQNNLSIDSNYEYNMMCYPSPIKIEDEIHLLFNQNNFGKYGFFRGEIKV